jgi:hypothetical protein
MTTFGWLLVAVIWIPTLVLLAGEGLRVYRDRRDRRRLERYMRDQAWAYRELDLSEPLGRPRLGIDTEEE